MTSITPVTLKLLRISLLKGIGPATLKKISSIPNFLSRTIDELADEIPQLRRAITEPRAWDLAQEAAHDQISQAEAFDASIISAFDERYPALLRATQDDPFLLFVRGSLAPNPENSVAVIGTREPTRHGKIVAERIASFFVDNQWSVVSGLALGCDALAHEATLQAGGHTVAVLAHGLQTIAPARHKKLAQQILDGGGALVSEYPFGKEPLPQNFVKRDRTQAGLSRGVVMIQSDLKGGSLHASRAAIDYGRWLAVPRATERDAEAGEPKVQANLLLAGDEVASKADLLRCAPTELAHIIMLNSRDDYEKMISPGQTLGFTREPVQGQLL